MFTQGIYLLLFQHSIVFTSFCSIYLLLRTLFSLSKRSLQLPLFGIWIKHMGHVRHSFLTLSLFFFFLFFSPSSSLQSEVILGLREENSFRPNLSFRPVFIEITPNGRNSLEWPEIFSEVERGVLPFWFVYRYEIFWPERNGIHNYGFY